MCYIPSPVTHAVVPNRASIMDTFLSEYRYMLAVREGFREKSNRKKNHGKAGKKSQEKVTVLNLSPESLCLGLGTLTTHALQSSKASILSLVLMTK